MKKLLIAFGLAALAVSCSSEIEIPVPVVPEEPIIYEKPITRVAGSGSAEIDPLSYLKEINFKIKNHKGETFHYRQSMFKFGNRVDLFTFDRYIGNGEIYGLHCIDENKYVSTDYNLLNIKGSNSSKGIHKFEKVPGSTNGYQLTMVDSGTKYMVRPNSNAKYIPYSNATDDYIQIVPDDTFEIKNIRYGFYLGDVFTVTPKAFMTRTLSNNTDSPVTRTIEISETISESSTYTDLEGMSVSNTYSSSMTIDIPDFGSHTMGWQNTVASNFSYQVSGTQTLTYTIKETFTMEVPPRTTYSVRMVASQYQCDITYFADMVGVSSKLPLTLTGRWKGSIVSDVDIEVFDLNENLVARIPATVTR